MRRTITECIDTLIYLAALGVCLFVALASLADAATPESRVRVLRAYLAAIEGPELPDSLRNRPRRNDSDRSNSSPAPIVVDLFSPYETEAEHDDDAEFAELLNMRQAIQLATPGQVLYVFSQDHRRCPPCREFHDNELGDLYDLSWPIVFVRVDRPSGERLTRHFGVSATPTTVAVDDGAEVGRYEGRPRSAAEITNLFKRPAPKAGEPVAVQTRRSRNATDCRQHVWGGWTWPGNGTVGSLRRHLGSPPHNFDRAWLQSLAPSQLVAVHDDWHNRNGSGGRARRGRRASYAEQDQALVL